MLQLALRMLVHIGQVNSYSRVDWLTAYANAWQATAQDRIRVLSEQIFCDTT
jgi:hypothetical protein